MFIQRVFVWTEVDVTSRWRIPLQPRFSLVAVLALESSTIHEWLRGLKLGRRRRTNKCICQMNRYIFNQLTFFAVFGHKTSSLLMKRSIKGQQSCKGVDTLVTCRVTPDLMWIRHYDVLRYSSNNDQEPNKEPNPDSILTSKVRKLHR